MIDAPSVDRLKADVLFYPVCPEPEIGLGVSRKSIRIASWMMEATFVCSKYSLSAILLPPVVHLTVNYSN
jgi:uncharacterized protein YbbK (DUF523 family)